MIGRSKTIALLGMWSVFFSLLLIMLPLVTLLPIGYGLVPLKGISSHSEKAVTTQKAVGEIARSERAPFQGDAVSKTSTMPEDIAPPKTDPLAKPVMALPTDDTLQDEPAPTAKVGSSVGNLAPDFTLKCLDSNSLSLSDLRGKTILLNFWSTTCGACIVQFPVIRAVYIDHGQNKEDLVVITVCIDGTTDRIKKIEDKYGDKYGPLDFPILLADKTEVPQSYGIWATPLSFFIDSNGIIKRVIPGRFETPEEIESILKSR